MSAAPQTLRLIISAILLVLVGLGGALLLSADRRDDLGRWLHGESSQKTIGRQLAVMRARQGEPLPPPANHAEALLRCSEAQDLAVAVSLNGSFQDAQLANAEMRRICQAYFDSASRRAAAAAPRF